MLSMQAYDSLQAVAAGPNDVLYVAGQSNAPSSLAFAGLTVTNPVPGKYEGFVGKLTPSSGVGLWGKLSNSTDEFDDNSVDQIVVDTDGYPVVAGTSTYASMNFGNAFVVNALQYVGVYVST